MFLLVAFSRPRFFYHEETAVWHFSVNKQFFRCYIYICAKNYLNEKNYINSCFILYAID